MQKDKRKEILSLVGLAILGFASVLFVNRVEFGLVAENDVVVQDKATVESFIPLTPKELSEQVEPNNNPEDIENTSCTNQGSRDFNFASIEEQYGANEKAEAYFMMEGKATFTKTNGKVYLFNVSWPNSSAGSYHVSESQYEMFDEITSGDCVTAILYSEGFTGSKGLVHIELQ